MPTHTTNYFNTFIEVAADTRAVCGTVPAAKGKPTAALLQYKLVALHPYCYTSDEVFFHVFAQKQGLAPAELDAARAAFFAKGQPCFRASPLTKTYGFGVHCNAQGKVALYGMETPAYAQLLADPSLQQVRAMRAGR